MDENPTIAMDRKEILADDPELLKFFEQTEKLYRKFGNAFITKLKRLPSLPDILIDRWERAALLGFGTGSNIYDNALVIGDVKVGKECWIGPNTILDGSGGLEIGDYCTISSGCHIYSHDNIKQTLSSKRLPIEREGVKIENNVYIAPNSIIAKGVTIGHHSVIGTGSFINKSVPPQTIVVGQPAKAIGKIEIKEDEINFIYDR